MLIGPTATGKTTQAKDAAFQLGMGFEIVVLDEGWDAAELFGGYTRAGKDWTVTLCGPQRGAASCGWHPVPQATTVAGWPVSGPLRLPGRTG